MRNNFNKAVDFVLRCEGGYVNDPNDPGGETNYGISKNSYPELDIKNLTIAQVKDIYKADYWIPMGCDELIEPLDIVVFDTAVNMGKKRANDFLNQCQDDWKTYLFLRIKHYNEIAKNPDRLKFLRGWLNRIIDLWRLIEPIAN